jgi:hypothetical protein
VSVASDRSRRQNRAVQRSWPALGYEALPWTAQYETHATSRSERRKHRGPYQAAIPPKISNASLELSGELAAKVGEASAELARFDELMGGEIAHFSAILLRSESAASSRIETSPRLRDQSARPSLEPLTESMPLRSWPIRAR